MPRQRASRSARPGAGPRRSLAGDASGATAIEFAVVIAMIILIVIGTLQFGRALMARNEMSHALAQAVRTVHLRPTTTSEEIVAQLEARLAGYAGADLDVSVTAISGTTFMQIAVSFPFAITLPFTPVKDITLSVETLAPMVSPTQ